MRWALSIPLSILIATTVAASDRTQIEETKSPAKKVDFAELKIRLAIQRLNIARKREIRAGWKLMQARELASWLVAPEVQFVRSVGVRISAQREYANDREINCYLFLLWLDSDAFKSFHTYIRFVRD